MPSLLEFAARYKTALPLEILDKIICVLLTDDYRFEAISGFASSCHVYRQVALRCFFMHLRVSDARRWGHIPDLGDKVNVVKSLVATSNAVMNPPIPLLSFHALRYVQLTFFGVSVLRQHQSLQVLIASLPTTLTTLILEDLADIDLTALTTIGARFSGLTRLELSCVERLDDSCCWGCFEESAGLIWHSPIPDIYSDAMNLAACVSLALKPLSQLKHLYLGLFLSPEHVLQEHFAHSPEFDADRGTVVRPFGPEWCPSCFECCAAQVRADELQAALNLAQTFRKLKTVSWASFFSMKAFEVKERKTSVYVDRKEGRIRVRRKPW